VRILLTTEGTFPYRTGGVSTWAHSLAGGLSDHEFAVVALVPNPPTQPALAIPSNTVVLPVPLWGLERIDEYLPRPAGGRRPSWRSAATSGFLECLEPLLDQVLRARSDPVVVCLALGEIAEFAERYDLRRAMESEAVSQLIYDRLATNAVYRHARLHHAIEFARTLYRFLLPLAVPLPEVDVVHASAAAICSLPAIAAKVRNRTPMVLTEHGVYLRERILDMVHRRTEPLEKMLFSNFYRAIALAAYHAADRVVPVCEYNARWERELGVDETKIQVIRNGVDPNRFSAGYLPQVRPTISWVGRIHPLKDLLTLIRAVRLSVTFAPTMLCRVFGPDHDPEYAARCRAVVHEADLTETIIFEGPTDDPVSVYHSSDVVVLSSISEGFPYAVVEAMMCGRPVVSTDVGGVSEALGDPSLVAEPQNASSLAQALTNQLSRSAADRNALGMALRQRALDEFSEARFLASYDGLYRELSAGRSPSPTNRSGVRA
jgi:glycosyltransferase involved in cell wall biosynthesis